MSRNHDQNETLHETQGERIRPALDLSRTVMHHLSLYRTHPWDAIPSLPQAIVDRGIDLPYDQYDEIAESVWVHVSAYLAPTARLCAPVIVCGGAKIGHHTLVSGSVIGAFASIGEFSTVRGSVLFDRSTLCGHNELLSSILGYKSLLHSGAIAVDTRLDGQNVTVEMPDVTFVTGKSRLGAVLCDSVTVGASCVLEAGSVIDYGTRVPPLTRVNGYRYPYTEEA